MGYGKVEIQKQDSHFPTAPKACGARNKNITKGARMLRPHQALAFRIILHWNRNPISGSSLDWKMLSAVLKASSAGQASPETRLELPMFAEPNESDLALSVLSVDCAVA